MISISGNSDYFTCCNSWPTVFDIYIYIYIYIYQMNQSKKYVYTVCFYISRIQHGWMNKSKEYYGMTHERFHVFTCFKFENIYKYALLLYLYYYYIIELVNFFAIVHQLTSTCLLSRKVWLTIRIGSFYAKLRYFANLNGPKGEPH